MKMLYLILTRDVTPRDISVTYSLAEKGTGSS